MGHSEWKVGGELRGGRVAGSRVAKRPSPISVPLARSIRALLYRIQWDTGFNANLFMICDTPESAAGFDTVLGLLTQASKNPPAKGGLTLPPILQKIESHRDGARLELDVSGPPEMLDQILPQGGT